MTAEEFLAMWLVLTITVGYLGLVTLILLPGAQDCALVHEAERGAGPAKSQTVA